MRADMIKPEDSNITFDGYDGADLVVKRIAIWRDYDDRAKGMVCAVRHGHPGILLERQGDACLVKVEWMGKEYEGWVTYWFIKELKTNWQLSRINRSYLTPAQRHRPI